MKVALQDIEGLWIRLVFTERSSGLERFSPAGVVVAEPYCLDYFGDLEELKKLACRVCGCTVRVVPQ